MVWRYGLGQVAAATSRMGSVYIPKPEIGKVFGIVTTENTPTKEAFERVGGYSGVGAIFYLEYENSKNITGSIDVINRCKIAYPKDPQSQYYPVRGELVLITHGPGRSDSNTAANDFYTLFNIWNNKQNNAKLVDENDTLGAYYTENPNVRALIPYEGDNILGGRQGSSLRFSTTTKGVNPSNEWSAVGGEYDPIVILANGLKYDPSKKFYIEQINKDDSSIYLTSTQKVFLETDKKGVLNNITNPISVSDYTSAQIILNSDRVVLNSKKDDVIIFAKTNIELNTQNIINLNADERIHLNTNNAIFLGAFTSTPHQPALLGNNTIRLLQNLQRTLTTLGAKLQAASAVKEGSPMPIFNTAGAELLKDMKVMAKQLNDITSKRVFIK
jgi:hypothetical protein